MRRLLAAAVLVALVLPAAAHGDEVPKKLWSEFPLVQEVERSSTPSLSPDLSPDLSPSLGPLLPPDESGPAPGGEGGADWAIWGAALAAGLLALLVATRVVRPVSGARRGDREEAVQLRPHNHPVPAPEGSTLAQYAPSPSLILADAPEAPWRSVVRRTGLLRSRYVVLEGESADDQHAVASSKGFWSIGGADARERSAEDVWDELVNELRASGWEPEPTRRSDFYVLLKPVEPEEPASIVSTLEAYGGTVDDDAGEV